MDEILSNELKETLSIFETPKFMITKNEEDEPNSALVMTWTVYQGNQLVYGDFMGHKTKQNLEKGNDKIGLLVLKMNLDNWNITAKFDSYHVADEVYEFMAMTPLFRYNQYTNVRGAGLAEAIWVGEKQGLSKMSVLLTYLRARLSKRKVSDRATGKGRMPPAVLDRFNMMAAVKILGYVDSSGFPRAFPAFGMLPASEDLLVVERSEERKRGIDLRDGQRVAVSLVTQEPAAFQVKGEFKPIDRKTAAIVIDKVYACSLPRPGLRIDQPLLEPDSR